MRFFGGVAGAEAADDADTLVDAAAVFIEEDEEDFMVYPLSWLSCEESLASAAIHVCHCEGGLPTAAIHGEF